MKRKLDYLIKMKRKLEYNEEESNKIKKIEQIENNKDFLCEFLTFDTDR